MPRELFLQVHEALMLQARDVTHCRWSVRRMGRTRCARAGVVRGRNVGLSAGGYVVMVQG